MFFRYISFALPVFLFSFLTIAEVASFLPEDDYETNRKYWEEILSGDRDIDTLSPKEKISLLSYLGLHPSEEFIKKNPDISALRLFSREIILDDDLQNISSESPFIREKVDELVPLIRFILTSSKYENLLYQLYLDIADRPPLDFWSNYDVFKNMIAWGAKKNRLFVNEEIEIAKGVHKQVSVPGPELKRLSDALEEDIAAVAKSFDFTSPKIQFVYQVRNPATAWYRYRNHKIFINLASKNLSWPNLMARALWHELYHGWQYSGIEKYIASHIEETIGTYISSDHKEKEKIFLIGVYHSNLFNYQESKDNYSHYKDQPLEEHAFYFGNQLFEKIF